MTVAMTGGWQVYGRWRWRYLADPEALVEDEAFLEEGVGQAPARLLDQLDVVQVAAPL